MQDNIVEILEDCNLQATFTWLPIKSREGLIEDFLCLIDCIGVLNMRPKYSFIGTDSEIDACSERTGQGTPKIFLARYLLKLLFRRMKLQRNLERGKGKFASIERRAKVSEKEERIAPLPLRFQILARDNFKCRYCGRDPEESQLVIDHIVPKSKGGANNISNYITSCRECNAGKRDVLLTYSKKRGFQVGKEGQIPSSIGLANNLAPALSRRELV